MRTITIAYDQSHYIYRWLKPMMAARKEFKILGYKLEYTSILDYFPVFSGKRMHEQEKRVLKNVMNKRHDIVMLAFHHSTSVLGRCAEKERGNILKKIKANANILLWMDTADSTGTCLFDVMPNVDLYFKKQLLNNREDYCRDIWGGRIFCEYYHDLLKVDDKQVTERYYPPLDKQYSNKLRISWNVGIGDLFANPYQLLLKPFKVTKPKFINPENKKLLDIQYRGSGYSPIAGYPRAKSRDLLKEVTDIKCSDVTKKIPHKDYVLEMQSAKSILSPFGWGEICGRDFEAMAYGATMIKQSMEHCCTYPDIYKPWETYVPLKWDFSDYKELISKASSQEYRRIAIQGQNQYRYYFTQQAKMEFAKHIVNEIQDL